MRRILSKYVFLFFVICVVFALPLEANKSTGNSINTNDTKETDVIKKSSVIIFYEFPGSGNSKIGLTGNDKVDSLKIENFLKKKNQVDQQKKETLTDSSFDSQSTPQSHGSTRKKVNAVQKIGEWHSLSDEDSVKDSDPR